MYKNLVSLHIQPFKDLCDSQQLLFEIDQSFRYTLYSEGGFHLNVFIRMKYFDLLIYDKNQKFQPPFTFQEYNVIKIYVLKEIA